MESGKWKVKSELSNISSAPASDCCQAEGCGRNQEWIHTIVVPGADLPGTERGTKIMMEESIRALERGEIACMAMGRRRKL